MGYGYKHESKLNYMSFTSLKSMHAVMADRPSSSTQDGGDTISNTHPEMSSDDWFSMLRERAAQSKPVYNLPSPPSCFHKSYIYL